MIYDFGSTPIAFARELDQSHQDGLSQRAVLHRGQARLNSRSCRAPYASLRRSPMAGWLAGTMGEGALIILGGIVALVAPPLATLQDDGERTLSTREPSKKRLGCVESNQIQPGLTATSGAQLAERRRPFKPNPS